MVMATAAGGVSIVRLFRGLLSVFKIDMHFLRHKAEIGTGYSINDKTDDSWDQEEYIEEGHTVHTSLKDDDVLWVSLFD